MAVLINGAVAIACYVASGPLISSVLCFALAAALTTYCSYRGAREAARYQKLSNSLEAYIAERERAREEALAELQAFKDAMNRHVIVAITDRAGRIIECNELFSEISGYPLDELLGRTHSIINSGHHPRSFFVDLWRTIADGRVWEGDICNRRKSGEVYWVATTIIPITNAKTGAIEKFLSVRRDITKQRGYESSLVEAKALAEDAALTKSRFLANMSHEIRTPLTGIIGLAELLLEGKSSEAATAYHLQLILRNSKHLLEVINHILDISKIDANEFSITSEEVDVQNTLYQVTQLLQPQLDAKPDVALHINVDESVPTTISSDGLAIRQILTNLLANAIKFTNKGMITIGASLDITSRELRIAVSDTGIGLSPAVQETLFKMFSQGDTSARRRYEGTGLGLYISQRLATLLGGTIQVHSNERIGSTFTLILRNVPIPQSENRTAVLTLAPKGATLGATAESSRANGQESCSPAPRRNGSKRILVAEDNHSNRVLLEALLGFLPVSYEFAETGLEALDKVMGNNFDLILMDMQMPEMDGYEATKQLRERGIDIPIIALTANAFLEDRDACLKCGCSDFLGKPFRQDDFFAMVEQHLDLKEAVVSAA